MKKLLIVCAVAASLFFATTAVAEDIRLYLGGNSTQYVGPTKNGSPVVVIEDFKLLPYDYAKRLPPELYYWWARAHNARQYQRGTLSSPGVLRIRDNISYGKGYYKGETQYQSFDRRSSNGPATIYNPYFR